MQVLNVAAFEKRVVYNLAKTYGNQLSSGASYFDLNPVIALMRQLRQWLGELPEGIIEQIQKLSLEELDSLGMAIFDLTTFEDLSGWW